MAAKPPLNLTERRVLAAMVADVVKTDRELADLTDDDDPWPPTDRDADSRTVLLEALNRSRLENQDVLFRFGDFLVGRSIQVDGLLLVKVADVLALDAGEDGEPACQCRD